MNLWFNLNIKLKKDLVGILPDNKPLTFKKRKISIYRMKGDSR